MLMHMGLPGVSGHFGGLDNAHVFVIWTMLMFLCVCVCVCVCMYSAMIQRDFPDGSDGKESTCNASDPGLIPGWERSPGEGNGNPLQYSCLENPMNTGAWRATVCGVAESDTTE